MVIGIDASRAFIGDKTGTENYSFHVITSMLRLPEASHHSFVLFIRPNAVLPSELHAYANVTVKEIRLPYLWTQLGLAWETWFGGDLDVLWVPAHTLPVLRNPHLKTVVTIHGLEYQWLPEYKNLLQKWYLPLSTFYAAKSATKLIAVSEFTAKQLQEELHTSKKKIKVIHEGVGIEQRTKNKNIEYREKLYSRLNIQPSKYILFVGTVQPRKNLVALIEAFSHFASGYARDKAQIKLVIAGGTGWMVEDVMLTPSKYGVQEKVIFTGRVTDQELADLYLGALMYVQPSFTEGFGLPVLEAMGYGIPVVSSDGGALAEVVGAAGLIVPLGDGFVDSLSESMEKLVKNPQLRSKMIAAGKKKVKGFSWEKAAKETLKLLINL